MRDSILFLFERNSGNIGHCYNINTKEQVAILIGRGKAANEMSGVPDYGGFFEKDSIQFVDKNQPIIKTFSVQDILTKPAGERIATTITIPDSLFTNSYMKISGNRVVGSIFSGSDERNARFYCYEGGETSYFGEINEDNFRSKQKLSNKEMREDLMPKIAHYNNKLVVANQQGLLLEVYDLNSKTVDSSRYYSRIEIKKGGGRAVVGCNIHVSAIYCNENNISCIILKRNEEEEAKVGGRIYDISIITYDWQLNPIKKYFVVTCDVDKYRTAMSEDSKTFYVMSIDGEDQQLSACKLP